MEADRNFVVMDTAPTGHTLMLLDATGAYDREVSRQTKGVPTTHRLTPLTRLQNPKKTKVLLVSLAETIPVLEAAGLQADLRRANIEPWAWIVNNSVAAAHPQSTLLKQRAANEVREVAAVSRIHSKRFAVVPLLPQEPVGIDRLSQLAGPSLADQSILHR